MIVGQSGQNLEPLREIVRIVEGVEGSVALDVLFEPRPNYAKARGRLRARGNDWICTWRNEVYLLRSEVPLEARSIGAGATIEVKTGDRLCFSLSHEQGDIAILLPLGERALGRVRHTQNWWQEWSNSCACSEPYRDAVLRSAITLKLLTFALSGAVVAAATTSLPEWIGADHNWDYRYCWLRDAALTMRAFIALELKREAGSFLRWLLHATALTRPRLGVVYDVFGRTNLREWELDEFSGYRNSRPVRIGNAAHAQTQLDVYGGVTAAAA